MVIPLFKVVAVVGKTFAKPFVAMAKQSVKKNNNSFMTRNFIWMGHKAHYFEMIINKKFFGMKIDADRMKKLSDEDAMEYATSFFLEVVFLYGLILGIAILEIKKAAESSAKDKEEKERIKSAVANLEQEVIATKNLLLQLKDSIPNVNIVPQITNHEDQGLKELVEKVKTLEAAHHASHQETTNFINQFTNRLLHKDSSPYA